MPFGSLWLPGLASAVVVFVASSIAHMVLKHHKADYKSLPNEDAVADVMRRGKIQPGSYTIPHCTDPSQMKDPAVLKKYTDGPVALVTVLRSGAPSMGKCLGQWFLYCLLVSFVTAYVARHTLDFETTGAVVWRITGTVAVAAYALAQIPESIWKGQPWSNTLRGLADAVVYGLLTGATFMILWP